MPELLTFTAASFEEDVLKAEGLVVVEFHATWCTHSKRLTTLLRSTMELYDERVKFGRVDVFDEHPLPQQYRIFHTPSLLFFRNGEEIARLASAAAREHMKDKLEELAGA